MKKTILVSLAGLALFLAGCTQQTPASNQNLNQPAANINQNVNQPVVNVNQNTNQATVDVNQNPNTNQPAVNQNVNTNQPTPTGQTTSKTEEATGIIKLVYSKSGKNYLDIDYVELNPNWAPGGMSGPAYQNSNPKIRTFEISPDAKFVIGAPRVSITFSEFQNLFSPSNTSYQKGNPWDIVIVDGMVTNITEHFIP